MKYLPTYFFILGLAVRIYALNAAGDPFAKPPGGRDSVTSKPAPPAAPATWYRLIVEVISVKRDAVPNPFDEPTAGARWRGATALSKAGKAHREILFVVTARDGHRARAESIDEARFWNDFAAPSEPGEEVSPGSSATSNLGDKLEWEVKSDPDLKHAELAFVLQRTNFHGMYEFAFPQGGPTAAHPLLSTQKIASVLSVTLDEPQYLGTLSPSRAAEPDRNETWLAFATVQRIPLGELVALPKASTREWTVECSIYSLDRNDAQNVAAAAAKLEAPFEATENLCQQGRAKRESLTSVSVHPGERSRARAGGDFRYPTEFEPPYTSTDQEGSRRVTETEEDAPHDANHPQQSRRETKVTEETYTPVAGSKPQTIAGQPTAFEYRELGLSFEVEPTLRPEAGAMDAAAILRDTENRGVLEVQGAAERYPFAPLFEARNLGDGALLVAGKHVLFGTLNPPGADGANHREDSGRTWLVFLRLLPQP
ncbi:MAG TPA: hypothetical protein VGH90_07765 [Chthoniobacteraceae bacterium]|jgi:hypothetical protein